MGKKFILQILSILIFLYSFSFSEIKNSNEQFDSLDPETINWLNRAGSAGGTVSDSVIAAIDDYVKEIKGLKYQSVNIRDKIIRENWFCGNFNSALVPLFVSDSSGSVSGFNTDINHNYSAASFSDTGQASGFTGNGLNRYLETGLNPYADNELLLNDVRFMIYSLSNNPDAGRLGCRDNTGSGFYFYPKYMNGNTYFSINSNVESIGQIPSANGYIMMQRNSQTNSELYYGDNLIYSGNSNSTSKANQEITIGAFNNFGTVTSFMSMQLGGYSIGKSFNVQELQIHYTAVQRLMSRLKRIDASGNEIDFKSKLFTFTGDKLVINYQTQTNGFLQFELQNSSGIPITNYTLQQCPPISGNSYSHTVSWNSVSNLSSLINTPVYLRIKMSDADLYSIQFKNEVAPTDSSKSGFKAGAYKQFFADTLLFGNNIPAIRKMNSPVKIPSPVISPQNEWEGNNLMTTYSNIDYSYSIFQNRMVYKMWVRSIADNQKWLPLYYESVDGLNWTRPNLESYKYNGNMNNNIITDSPTWGFVTVVDDSLYNTSDSTRRYKSVYNTHTTAANSKLNVSFSYDGLIWVPYAGNPVRHIGEDLSSSGWNPVIGKYLGYFRDSLGIRKIGRYISNDWINWTYTGTILKPDAGDIPGSLYYNFQVLFKDSVYWGFLGHLQLNQNYEEDPVNPSRTDNTVFIELLFSRDGINFVRCGNRQPFLNYGSLGSWDDQMVFTFGVPVRVGNEFNIYYNGFNYKHMSNPPAPYGGALSKSQIGLAKIGVDRFVSLKAY